MVVVSFAFAARLAACDRLCREITATSRSPRLEFRKLPDACTFRAAFHDRVCHLLHGNSDSDFFRPGQARQDFASVCLCLEQIVDLLFQVIHASHFSSSACFFKMARSIFSSCRACSRISRTRSRSFVRPVRTQIARRCSMPGTRVGTPS